jgi:hypothetical protein
MKISTNLNQKRNLKVKVDVLAVHRLNHSATSSDYVMSF